MPTRQGAAEADLRQLRLALTVALLLCFGLVLALGIGVMARPSSVTR